MYCWAVPRLIQFNLIQIFIANCLWYKNSWRALLHGLVVHKMTVKKEKQKAKVIELRMGFEFLTLEPPQITAISVELKQRRPKYGSMWYTGVLTLDHQIFVVFSTSVYHTFTLICM